MAQPDYALRNSMTVQSDVIAFVEHLDTLREIAVENSIKQINTPEYEYQIGKGAVYEYCARELRRMFHIDIPR